MNHRTVSRKLAVAALALVAAPLFGQAPPLLPPGELDHLVDRIALYPDSLLSQTLAGATYSDQIPDAARWADQHHYLTGRALADAIQADRLPWDPSVQALLPFPSVMDMMASDMFWTRRLGDAFLSQQADVMDAVQRERRKARDFGYLRTGPQIVVSGGPYIAITTVDPLFVPVPWYDPAVVFYAPRAGFVVGGAIRFGFGVTIGTWFQPWGWGGARFDWGAHVAFVNGAPWRRVWETRTTYVHNYTIQRATGPRPPEAHELHERSSREFSAQRSGGRYREEHGRR